MMRLIFMLVLMVPMMALGQGSIRRFSTIAKMVQMNPQASAVSGKLTAEVVGYHAEGDCGGSARMVDWIATSALATNRANVFDSPFGGQWVFRDRNSAIQDSRWWSMQPDGSDISDAWDDMVAFQNDYGNPTIQFPPGTYQHDRPLTVPHNYPFALEGAAGGYGNGWYSDTNITEVTFLYTGPYTNVAFSLKPTLGFRLGITMRRITIDANSLADVALLVDWQSRGTIEDVRPRNATIGAKIGNTYYVDFRNLSVSSNEREFDLAPNIGILVTNQANVNTFRNINVSGTTTWGLVISGGSMANTFIGGGIESNEGGGVLINGNCNHNGFDGMWFEANGNTNRFIQVDSAAYLNDFQRIKFENRLGKIYIDGSYTRVSQSQIGKIEFGPNAGNCWAENVFLEVGGQPEGYTQFQNILNIIDGFALLRTNILQNVISFRGGYLELLRGTEEYPKSMWTRDGIYWGAGDTNSPDAGWTRLSGNSLATSNSIVTFRSGANDSLWNAYVTGDANARVSININGTYGAGPGGSGGIDTWWKRNGQSNWITEAQTWVSRADTNDTAYATILPSSAFLPFVIRADGQIEMGSKLAQRDVVLKRTGAGSLAIKTNLAVSGGVLSWDDGATNAGPTLAPRRSADYAGQITRLVGALALTERSSPTTPEASSMSIWLDEADFAKRPYLKWPDGTDTLLWHAGNDGSGSGLDSDLLDGQHGSYYLDRGNHTGSQSYTTVTGLGDLATVDYPPIDGNTYGINNGAWTVVTSGSSYTFSNGVTNSGGTVSINIEPGSNITFATNATKITISAVTSSSTNGTPVSVDGGSVLTAANLSDTSEINHTASGTNVTSALIDGSISTNRINPTFHGWISGKQDALTFSTGVTNAGGTIRAELAPGANITFATNSQTITISATAPASTNSWQIGVDGSVVTAPNLANSPEIDPSASGTNVTMSLVAGSIATNKIDTTFHQWVLSQGGSSVAVDGSGMPAVNLKDGAEIAFSATSTNVTASVVSGSLSTNRANTAFRQWVDNKVLYVHGTEVASPNLIDTGTVEITATGSNIELDVPDGSITYTKLQNVSATNRVIGLGSTAPGDAVELVVGDGLITSSTDLKLNIEAGSGIELATNGSKRVTITSKGYTPANDAVANLLLVTSSETEDKNSDNTFRDVTPTARSGMSTTIPAGTLMSGSVMKIEMAGEMDVTSSDWDPEIRVVLDGPTGTDYTINLVMNEPGSSFPEDTTTWKAEILIVINSAGSPATIYQRSHVLYADGSMAGSGSLAGYALMTSGVPSNSLNTAADNTIRIDYRGTSGGTFPTAMESFKVSSVIIWML